MLFKIIEKLIYIRLSEVFQKHNVIYTKQYGFQKKTILLLTP